MGFFIIAGVLIIIAIIIFIAGEPGVCGIAFMLALLMVLLGLFANWGGFEEPIICEQYELIPLIEDTNIYLIESNDGTKMCKYKVSSKHDNEIQNNIIKKIRSDVEVEYIEEEAKPVIREYVLKPKESNWNGVFASERRYSVLFVPESYILK